MIRIHHRQPALGRQSFLGIEFRDGVTEVEALHPEREKAFIQHGHRVEYTVDQLAEDFDVDVPLSALSIKRLRQVAEDSGVDIPKNLRRKAEIVLAIEAELAHLRALAAETDPDSRVSGGFELLPEVVSNDPDATPLPVEYQDEG